MENLNTIVSKYLDFCKHNKNLTNKTLKSYSIDLKQFNNFVMQNESELSKDAINKYIAHLQMNYKIKTVKRKIASAKAFCNYLEYENIIKETPFNKVRLKLHEPNTILKIFYFYLTLYVEFIAIIIIFFFI